MPRGRGDSSWPRDAISSKSRFSAPASSLGTLGFAAWEHSGEEKGSWQAKRPRGHTGIGLAPKCQPARGPGVLASGLLSLSRAFTGDLGLNRTPGRSATVTVSQRGALNRPQLSGLPTCPEGLPWPDDCP